MNSIARQTFGMLSHSNGIFGKLLNEVQPAITRNINRSIVAMASRSVPLHGIKKIHPSSPCGCGCGIMNMHTKGDRELVEFLQEEITAEKENQRAPTTPTKMGEFDIKGSGAELNLHRNFNDEKITISLNVNHSVQDQATEEDEGAELLSQPDFEVDIKIGSKTLSFSMSYVDIMEKQEGQSEDTFGISEVTIFEGEADDKMYCVSGDILDEALYDLFMNMLAERGITQDFAAKLSTLCTSYEHSQYINLLESVQSFVKRK